MTRRQKQKERIKVKNEGRRLVIRLMKFQRKMEKLAMIEKQKEIEKVQAQGKILSPVIGPNMVPIEGQLPPGAEIRAIPIQIPYEQLQSMLAAQNQNNNSGIVIPR